MRHGPVETTWGEAVTALAVLGIITWLFLCSGLVLRAGRPGASRGLSPSLAPVRSCVCMQAMAITIPPGPLPGTPPGLRGR